jgi:hypothetical protein
MNRVGVYSAFTLGILFFAPSLVLGQPASAPASAPAADPRALALLKNMNAFMTQPKNLTFTVELTGQSISPEKKEAFNLVWDIFIQRPNRLAIVVTSKEPQHFNTYYDGQKITIYSPMFNKYQTEKAEGTIDETIMKFPIDFRRYPFVDLVKNDVYRGLTSDVTSGQLGDKAKISEVETQELRFGQGQVNWSIWIETGDQPWPRMMAAEISSPDGTTKTTLTLLFTKWATPAELPAGTFTFKAPEGAMKIESNRPASAPAVKPQ